MAMIDDRAYLAALVRFRKFGSVRLGRLLRRFNNPKRAFEASATDLIECGIESNIANRFLQERSHIEPEKEWNALLRHNVQILAITDEDYPELLKQIYDPPAVIFYKGELPDPNRKHVAVVGSRKATDYGKRATDDIVRPLAQHGTVIVSGLAYGIDATAHQATLEVQGTTLAILGSGLDDENIYPSAHRSLVSRILSSGGAVISEFPIGTPPLKQNFPFRNRIISGLSHGTLVVEAAIKSGSLITARAALEQNRDVFAVPGSIHAPLSEGPNTLIKEGATPVTHAADILGFEPIKDPGVPLYKPTTEVEQILFDLLGQTPLHIDELIRKSELKPSKIASTLTFMEMKGGVRHNGSKFYSRTA